jgi:ketosteroid isomerase-like protein
MSEEKLEIIRRLYNAVWAPGSLNLMPEVLHPDVIWTAIEWAPDAGTRRGYEECRAHLEDWLEDFELQPQVVELEATTDDGRLVCSQRAVATGRGSGAETTIRYAGVYRFSEDNRLIEIREYATTPEALQAAGLTE